MKLIVNKTTGRIINDYLLKDGEDLECENLLASWTLVDGTILYPEDSEVTIVGDSVYDFNLDPDRPGHTKHYYYDDGVITVKYVVEPEFAQYQIAQLQEKLKESDYKIIKAYEAHLVDGAVSYDFEAVHTERQEIRDKINYLQALIIESQNDKK